MNGRTHAQTKERTDRQSDFIMPQILFGSIKMLQTIFGGSSLYSNIQQYKTRARKDSDKTRADGSCSVDTGQVKPTVRMFDGRFRAIDEGIVKYSEGMGKHSSGLSASMIHQKQIMRHNLQHHSLGTYGLGQLSGQSILLWYGRSRV